MLVFHFIYLVDNVIREKIEQLVTIRMIHQKYSRGRAREKMTEIVAQWLLSSYGAEMLKT